MRRPVVMGNWKLNGSKEMARNLVSALATESEQIKGIDIVIAPPTLYMDLAERIITKRKGKILLGAQDTDVNKRGAFTGDTSPAMLKEFGVTHVIIGHSERRRYHGESDKRIAEKFGSLLESNITPVLCIGETEAQNEAGETHAVCTHQVNTVIRHLGIQAFKGAIIAYEPIWAIGTGKAATAVFAQKVHASIRKVVAEKDEDIAKQVVIQYGGSVNPENSAALFSQPDIDGALVGGASLDVKSFMAIIKSASASLAL